MEAGMTPKPTESPLDVEAMLDQLSNWSRWGKQDERGALNLITPRKRVEAAALVREGAAISLSRDAIKTAEDDSPPFQHAMVETGWNNEISSSDIFSVRYHGFTVTHLDALCHVFHRGLMYNGYSQREVTEQGAGKLAVARVKDGLFTRAVLMDIPRLRAVPYLEGGDRILPSDLDACECASGVEVRPGDALVIRTGRWARRAAVGSWPIMQDSAGLHYSCMPWLRERDISVLMSDLASDVMPSGVTGVILPVHLIAIVGLGVHIVDNCDLEALAAVAAARERWEFLLMAAPLAVEGGTGSPINPVAIL
jgi:kynurenine formamidase